MYVILLVSLMSLLMPSILLNVDQLNHLNLKKPPKSNDHIAFTFIADKNVKFRKK